MSYYCELKIHFNKGTSEDIKSVMSYLKNVVKDEENTGKSENKEPFRIEDMTIYTDNGMTRSNKIWGEETLNPEPDLYIEIAEAAPAAEWSAKSYRVNENGGYGETHLEAEYADNKLNFRVMPYVDWFSINTLIEDAYDLYCDDTSEDEQIDLEEFTEKFDFDNFCNYYTPDETVTEDNFEQLKAENAGLFCTEDGDVSLSGWWEERKFHIYARKEASSK